MTKKLKSTFTKNKPRKYDLEKIGVGCFVTIVCLILLWPIIRNESFYSMDKNEAKADIQTLLDKFHPSATLVYTDVVDQACDDSSSVGLAHSVHCQLEGYKFYATQDKVETKLQSLDKMLESDGWKRFDSSYERDLRVLNGDLEDSVAYQRERQDGMPSDNLYLEFYKNIYSISDQIIDDQIRNGEITVPHPSATIFGVRFTKTYWSCRDSSIFKLPCPIPPSEIK